MLSIERASGGFESGTRDARTCAHNSRGPRFESRRLPWHAPICCATRRPVEECPAVQPVGSEPKPRTQAAGRHFKKTTHRWLHGTKFTTHFSVLSRVILISRWSENFRLRPPLQRHTSKIKKESWLPTHQGTADNSPPLHQGATVPVPDDSGRNGTVRRTQ